MSFNLQNIVRQHILSLAPYSSARDEYTGKEGIFLDANENPLGSVTPENWNRYPDPYQVDIKEKIVPILFYIYHFFDESRHFSSYLPFF